MKIGKKLSAELTEALGRPVDCIEGEEAAIAIWNAALEKAMSKIHEADIHRYDREKLIITIRKLKK